MLQDLDSADRAVDPETDQNFDRPIVSAFERLDLGGEKRDAGQAGLTVRARLENLEVRRYAFLGRDTGGVREQSLHALAQRWFRRLSPAGERRCRQQQENSNGP